MACRICRTARQDDRVPDPRGSDLRRSHALDSCRPPFQLIRGKGARKWVGLEPACRK